MLAKAKRDTEEKTSGSLPMINLNMNLIRKKTKVNVAPSMVPELPDVENKRDLHAKMA